MTALTRFALILSLLLAPTVAISSIRSDLLARVSDPSSFLVAVILQPEESCDSNCELITNTLDKVEAVADGLITFGRLYAGDTISLPNGEEATVASTYNVTHVPTMLMYLPGSGTRSLGSALRIDHIMASNLLSAGAKAVYDSLKSFVANLVVGPVRGASAFSSLLSDAPPLLPRVLLLHDKVAPPSALFRKLALDYASRAVFGLVPAADDAPLLTAFGLQASDLPALRIAPSGASAADPLAPGAFSEWSAYPASSPMALGTLGEWLNSTLPPVPLPQLRGTEDFATHCGPHTGVCMIAVLPPGGGSALPVLSRVASRAWLNSDFDGMSRTSGLLATRHAVSFSWVDSEAQGEWASAFRGASAPCLIALNARKKLFAVTTSAFREAGLADFVSAVLKPKAPGAPGGMPRAGGSAGGVALPPPLEVNLERIDSVPTLIEEEGAPAKKTVKKAPAATPAPAKKAPAATPAPAKKAPAATPPPAATKGAAPKLDAQQEAIAAALRGERPKKAEL